MDAIRSSSNPLVKRVRAVVRGKEGGLVALEGERLVSEALRQGLAPEVVLVSEARSEEAADLASADLTSMGLEVHVVTDSLFASLSQLTTPAGLLAVFPRPRPGGSGDLPAEADALVVVAAGIQDPGNLGALARTAEAFGAGALVALPGGCSPWSFKALRGSMGSLLRLPVLELGPAAEAWEALSGRGFRHVCARTRGGVDPTSVDWGGRVALWAFAESGEIPRELDALVDAAEGVTIPLAGEVESLNVTAAAAILLYAARARTLSEAP